MAVDEIKKRDPTEAMILAGLNAAARFATIRSEIDRYIMEDILRAALSEVEWVPRDEATAKKRESDGKV